jgi:hypothetical protein
VRGLKVKTRIKYANEWLAIKGTKAFGTMAAFYICLVYGLLPLWFPGQQDTILYWSNFAQLAALPLLMVGQNLLDRAAERRAQKQYEMVKEELKLLRELVAGGSKNE